MSFLPVVSLLLLAAVQPAFGGGADGGTNTDKDLKLVDFKKVGERRRIDPRTFEGIYSELQPRLRALEDKIPGIRKQLEAVFDQRGWAFTDQEFEPRTADEIKPISQNKTHVLLTVEKVSKMSREELKKAWLHEAVRRLVEDGGPMRRSVDPVTGKAGFVSLSQIEIDQVVEGLTVALYNEYDMPAQRLTDFVNAALGNTLIGFKKGFLSRADLYQRVRWLRLREKAHVCLDVVNEITFSRLTCDDSDENGVHLDKPETFRPMVDKCVTPSDQAKILARLDELKNSKLQKLDVGNNPFRADLSRASWNDGYDSNDYDSLNQYGTGLAWLETSISAAIYGEATSRITISPESTQAEKVKLDNAGRILMAITGCPVHSPEEISLLSEAYSASPNEGATLNDVPKTFDELLKAMGQSPAQTQQAQSKISNASVDRAPARAIAQSAEAMATNPTATAAR